MSLNKKLVLFDIDGTIAFTDVSLVSIWKNIVETCVVDVFRVQKPNLILHEIDGLLDHLIIKRAAELAGITKAEFDQKKSEIVDRYIHIYKKTLAQYKRLVTPIVGAVTLLDQLISPSYSHIACLGIVTGNSENIAWDKLHIAGLKKYFSFGSFSDDAQDRPMIVKNAMQKANNYFAYSFTQTDIFIIGDTKNDITSAKVHGLKTIAVTSGHTHTLSDLQSFGADLAVSSLDDPRVLEFVLK